MNMDLSMHWEVLIEDAEIGNKKPTHPLIFRGKKNQLDSKDPEIIK